ncbi:hypothetical protein QLX67_01270 [Balneolaceae bacterium ANBcel3]|nr:hypothetical protein [Balneolaceae bacterium ANBcel3]
MMRNSVCYIILMALLGAVSAWPATAQERIEPELAPVEAPMSPLDHDIRNGIAFRIHLNNFGFGLGAEYRRVLARNTKGIFEFQISGLRDEREQSFQSYWGYSISPNKYNRVLVFPVLLGVQQRFLGSYLSDNFRFFVQASGGIAPAFVYPYFDHDMFGYGFRLTEIELYDPLQGWGDGSFQMGTTGHISIGANVGGDFGRIQSIRLGYKFFYYPSGIQVMEPLEPGPGFNVNLPPDMQPEDGLVPAYGKQSFFGTPHITFVIGAMW